MAKKHLGAACTLALLLVGLIAAAPYIQNFSQYGVWNKVVGMAVLVFCFVCIAGVFWYVNHLETQALALDKSEKERAAALEEIQTLQAHLLRRHEQEQIYRLQIASLKAELEKAERVSRFWMNESADTPIFNSRNLPDQV